MRLPFLPPSAGHSVPASAVPAGCSGCPWLGSGWPALWPVLSAPWCWVSAPFRPGVLGYGKRIPLVLLSQQCALLQGHSVYFKFKNPIRILSSLVIHRCFVSFQKQCFSPSKFVADPQKTFKVILICDFWTENEKSVFILWTNAFVKCYNRFCSFPSHARTGCFI